MADDKIVGSAYVLGTQMDPTYDPPRTSLTPPPSPAQRPTGQTVDLDEVRRRYETWQRSDADLAYTTAARSADDVPALLADLDAAREALRRAAPVVEAARAYRRSDWRTVNDVADALDAAVDTYETQEGTE